MAVITLGSGNQNYAYTRPLNSAVDDTIADFKSIHFIANLSGANEVPVRSTSATGAGFFALNFAQTALSLNVSITGLDFGGQTAPTDDNITGFHFHRAAAGVNGPVVWGAIGPDNDTDNDTVINAPGGTLTSVWDGSEGNAGATLAGELTNLLAGNIYLNVHTIEFSGGEIRSQLLSQGDGDDRIDLTGANIGSFTTLSDLLLLTSGGNTELDAVLETTLAGAVYRLELDGVAISALTADDFIFAGSTNDSIDGTEFIDHLFGAGGNDSLFGNAGNDILRGESGSDSLFGQLGADKHFGGDGFDYARYDNASGPVRASLIAPNTNTGEAAGDEYSSVEGLAGSASNDVLYGDDFANILIGNNGNDTLFGGLGADSLRGGDGVDYARYDDAAYGDLVLSLANPAQNTGSGAAGDLYNSIEGFIAGTGNDRIGGNGFINYLYGAGGNDIIAGNDGNDTLSGGAGLDTFRFNTPLNAATNRDTILDFVAADDTIELDRSFFSNTLPLGVLSADRFNTGAAASDASDRIIYNQATGALFFDADGSGSVFAQVQFATLSTKPTITNADFVILA